MYPGFITPRNSISLIGTHQRVDLKARKLIEPYVGDNFPSAREITKFEGYDGPDGQNIKSMPTSHLWDPKTDEGFVGKWVQLHYDRLVAALRDNDRAGAAWDAAWLAHYIADANTPPHQDYFDWLSIKELKTKRLDTLSKVRAYYRQWYPKGGGNQHILYEMGIAFLPFNAQWDDAKWQRALEIGPLEFLREECIRTMDLGIFDEYKHNGWSRELLRKSMKIVLPQAALDVAIIWRLADEAARK